MAIRKTTILVTILHDETDNVPSWSLERIAGEMGEGCVVGSMELVSNVGIKDIDVADELEAVGNDGEFFDRDEEIEG
jgi:hypothetical protein